VDHPSTLNSLNNLAVFLIEQDKTLEAEPLCRESLERHRRVLGPSHPDTLVANSVMGYVLLRQDKPKDAEPYVREAIAISRRVNGEDHQETLTFVHNLGMLLSDEGRFDEAVTELRTVVERGRRTLGQEHPVTLGATRHLAGLLMHQKEFAEAAALFESIEPVVRKDSTPGSVGSLASFLTRLGKSRTAIGQFEKAEMNLLEAQSLWADKASGADAADMRTCVQAIVDNYAAWEAAQPGKGYDAKAASWKQQLDALK
jgi:tetratricopeptide (TPR) repeat protein